MTQDNIDTHFRINPSWERYFHTKEFSYTPENYIEKAWALFVNNGYRYELERFSNNPNSKVYTAIKCIDLYHNDEFIVGRERVNESQALEQLLIMVICDFEVDFNTFK